jgi:hypothetical protein
LRSAFITRLCMVSRSSPAGTGQTVAPHGNAVARRADSTHQRQAVCLQSRCTTVQRSCVSHPAGMLSCIRTGLHSVARTTAIALHCAPQDTQQVQVRMRRRVRWLRRSNAHDRDQVRGMRDAHTNWNAPIRRRPLAVELPSPTILFMSWHSDACEGTANPTQAACGGTPTAPLGF